MDLVPCGEVFRVIAQTAHQRFRWEGALEDQQPTAILGRLAQACHPADLVTPLDLVDALLHFSNPKGRGEDQARVRHRLFCVQTAVLMIPHYCISGFGQPTQLIEVWTSLERRLSLTGGGHACSLATQLKLDIAELKALTDEGAPGRQIIPA